jgi:hypothetical protein
MTSIAASVCDVVNAAGLADAGHNAGLATASFGAAETACATNPADTNTIKASPVVDLVPRIFPQPDDDVNVLIIDCRNLAANQARTEMAHHNPYVSRFIDSPAARNLAHKDS